MDWQRLQGFRQVVRLGSFTKAAQATLRSQSAVSQQVKALEDELGCQLLERQGRQGMRLTPAGEKVLAFAGEMSARLEALHMDLRHMAGDESGWLRLAAPFTTWVTLLPDLVAQYLSRFPRVELTMLDRPQEGVIAAVRSGEVDMGIALESSAPKDLNALPWKRVEPVLITPHDHPLTRSKQVTLREIAEHPLILPPRAGRQGRRNRLEEALARIGATFRVIMESSNVELSSLFVARGVGISFASVAQGVKPPQEDLAFVSLSHLFASDHLAVILRKSLNLAGFRQAFVDILMSA